MKKPVTAKNFKKISTREINRGVIKFKEELNLYGASNGEYDLYTLLQVYLQEPIKTKRINDIINE